MPGAKVHEKQKCKKAKTQGLVFKELMASGAAHTGRHGRPVIILYKLLNDKSQQSSVGAKVRGGRTEAFMKEVGAGGWGTVMVREAVDNMAGKWLRMRSRGSNA